MGRTWCCARKSKGTSESAASSMESTDPVYREAHLSVDGMLSLDASVRLKTKPKNGRFCIILSNWALVNLMTMTSSSMAKIDAERGVSRRTPISPATSGGDKRAAQRCPFRDQLRLLDERPRSHEQKCQRPQTGPLGGQYIDQQCIDTGCRERRLHRFGLDSSHERARLSLGLLIPLFIILNLKSLAWKALTR